MEEIKWHDNYALGVDFIDKEHKQLFSTMNKLLRISEDEDKSEWACREGIKYLKNHTIEHFEHEEAYMRSNNYEQYDIHKRLHDNFRFDTLPALEEEMVETNYSIEAIRHFLGVCIGWVVAHTQTEDMAIVGKMASKWADIPHEEEIDSLEQAIIQLTSDMFQMKAKIISEQYAGEDFGKIICNRLIYRGQQNEKWEITLVFEESLLLKMIGRILNTDYQKIDDMIINVTRYITRQLLEKLREHIPSLDLYKIEKEGLLTHEQLKKSFDRSHPPCSLLFDTGEGYFAFCMATSDSIRGKLASSFDHKGALHAVHEYITADKTSEAEAETDGDGDDGEITQDVERKKKILVVDDSDFMRSRIIGLLAGSYEMAEADSSVSAIKNLTMDRPDLILLDYEMPVCDGRQTLEMIRSDKDIADIPVIFLTGRGDRETVQKVMELKPERYLLKTLPDERIKSNIDSFFSKK